MSGKALASRSGPTEACMKAGGEITKQMGKVDLSMLMVISTMVIGRMTRRMDLEFILILMEQGMKVIGRKISSMERG